MAMDSNQKQIRSFLGEPEQKRMVIHFPNLQIKTFRHKDCLQTLSLFDRRLRFIKTKDPKLLRIQVLDNLVFRFSCEVSKEALQSAEKVCARQLHRPLEKGWIQLHKAAVALGFWIDGPKPKLTVYAEQFLFV